MTTHHVPPHVTHPSVDADVGYTPRVVVKFKDNVRLPYEDNFGRYVDELKLGSWKRLTELFPNLRPQRMFTSIPLSRLDQLVARAQKQSPNYRPPNFRNYFLVNYPVSVAPQKLIQEIKRWESIQTVYYDSPGSEPTITTTDDPRFANQGYLTAAPTGIDAVYAWSKNGGEGQGQTLIDLERGWNFCHEDITGHFADCTIPPLYGAMRNGSRGHGTSVLGIVAARDNNKGGLGIVPNLSSLQTVSYWGWGKTRPDAMLAALDVLPFGGVLLIEAQLGGNSDGTGHLPIETQQAEFDVIQLATALGIVVIEAAGNSKAKLSFPPDSGAIMVGAATSSSPHIRLSSSDPGSNFGSNFGSRVDCYAWGEQVNTTDFTTSNPNQEYRRDFNGTSAASAIIAGAALAVQGIIEANFGRRLSGSQMRALLADSRYGTPAPGQGIGIMPNLRAIIDDALELDGEAAPSTTLLNLLGQKDVLPLSEVYIRDFAGDTGLPHNTLTPNSPDVVITTTNDTPQNIFAAVSPPTGSAVTVTRNQPHFIYLRAHNLGVQDATSVSVKVFFARSTTLLQPGAAQSNWQFLGTRTLPLIPAQAAVPGSALVADHIEWLLPATAAVGEGHLIVLVDKACEPKYLPVDFKSLANFQRFVSRNNKVTWVKLQIS